MRRRVLVLAVLALAALPAAARAALPRLVATGTGGYAWAGDGVAQALLPRRGSHTALVRLLHPDGTSTLVARPVLPPGAATGAAIDGSATGVLAFFGTVNDTASDGVQLAGPLSGPLTPFEQLAPGAYDSGWLLSGGTVLALRQRPGPTSSATAGSLAAFDLGGQLVAERLLAAPAGQEPREFRLQGTTRAVLYASIDGGCRAEAVVLDGSGPAVRIPAGRQGSYCRPEWTDWQVQADGKLAAVDRRPYAETGTLSWYGTDGARHRVPGRIGPGVPGLGFAGDRLLFARAVGPGRTDLVVRTLAGAERVLAHFDAAAAGGALEDFDGTRALWSTERCDAPARVWSVDVRSGTAAPAPRPAICALGDVEHETAVDAAGRAATTFTCYASGLLRCAGEARLSLRGRLLARLALSIRGGEARRVAFRLDARGRAALGAAGTLAAREDISWRDAGGRTHRVRRTLYLDGP